MHQHDVGTLLLQDFAHSEEHTRGHVFQSLPVFHDVEVVVGTDTEEAQHAVEHLAVLTRDANHGAEALRCCLQRKDERSHLDGLGARAENEHYFFHGFHVNLKADKPYQ